MAYTAVEQATWEYQDTPKVITIEIGVNDFSAVGQRKVKALLVALGLTPDGISSLLVEGNLVAVRGPGYGVH